MHEPHLRQHISLLFHTRDSDRFLHSLRFRFPGVGLGYETIRGGKADIMITGGADEVDFLSAGV